MKIKHTFILYGFTQYTAGMQVKPYKQEEFRFKPSQVPDLSLCVEVASGSWGRASRAAKIWGKPMKWSQLLMREMMPHSPTRFIIMSSFIKVNSVLCLYDRRWNIEFGAVTDQSCSKGWNTGDSRFHTSMPTFKYNGNNVLWVLKLEHSMSLVKTRQSNMGSSI